MLINWEWYNRSNRSSGNKGRPFMLKYGRASTLHKVSVYDDIIECIERVQWWDLPENRLEIIKDLFSYSKG